MKKIIQIPDAGTYDLEKNTFYPAADVEEVRVLAEGHYLDGDVAWEPARPVRDPHYVLLNSGAWQWIRSVEFGVSPVFKNPMIRFQRHGAGSAWWKYDIIIE